MLAGEILGISRRHIQYHVNRPPLDALIHTQQKLPVGSLTFSWVVALPYPPRPLGEGRGEGPKANTVHYVNEVGSPWIQEIPIREMLTARARPGLSRKPSQNSWELQKLLHSFHPVTGASVEIGYGNNAQAVGFDLIDDSVRKSVY